ncbi:MAG: ABC transporter permease subunit [Oscillospiraceae bacterium]|nr:ABC transporter permease subunit [Oscillospiraceae bacterium]
MVPKRWHTAAAVAFWLVVWQLGATLANRNLLIPVPTPVDTLTALWQLGGTESFWLAVGASAMRICLGFVSAVALGTVCAVLSERWGLFRVTAEPLLRLVRAVPVASVTILVFLWLPRERIPGFIAFLTVFPIVWSNVAGGIRSADRGLAEMARVFGMSRWNILRKITLPEIRPYFTAAIATGLGFAWKSGVAAEIICRTNRSLGNMLWSSKSAVAYDEVFALTLVIVVWSVVLESGTRALLKGGRHDTL